MRSLKSEFIGNKKDLLHIRPTIECNYYIMQLRKAKERCSLKTDDLASILDLFTLLISRIPLSPNLKFGYKADMFYIYSPLAYFQHLRSISGYTTTPHTFGVIM